MRKLLSREPHIDSFSVIPFTLRWSSFEPLALVWAFKANFQRVAFHKFYHKYWFLSPMVVRCLRTVQDRPIDFLGMLDSLNFSKNNCTMHTLHSEYLLRYIFHAAINANIVQCLHEEVRQKYTGFTFATQYLCVWFESPRKGTCRRRRFCARLTLKTVFIRSSSR